MKTYAEDAYYHVYNRGVNKQSIFIDEEDYSVFLNLFKRHLSDKPTKDKKGRDYPWFAEDIQLLAFCLMPNHFHALVYQSDKKAMTKLFKSINTTYGMYFNKKYKRVGPVFQSRFKASMIISDNYLLHISRYIHLNPKDYKKWSYSSLPYYFGTRHASWLDTDKISELFGSIKEYQQFLADYENYKKSLDRIKHELADK